MTSCTEVRLPGDEIFKKELYSGTSRNRIMLLLAALIRYAVNYTGRQYHEEGSRDSLSRARVFWQGSIEG